MHTLPRCGLIFSFQMPYFLHWLFSSTLLTQLKPPEASEQAAKKVEGTALKLPPGLTRPGPCEPKFWKNDLPANLFFAAAVCASPKASQIYTGFSVLVVLYYTIEAPEASEQAAKKVKGAALDLPPGLTRPGPCEPKFWKNDLPANLFLLCVLPQNRNEFTPAF